MVDEHLIYNVGSRIHYIPCSKVSFKSYEVRTLVHIYITSTFYITPSKHQKKISDTVGENITSTGEKRRILGIGCSIYPIHNVRSRKKGGFQRKTGRVIADFFSHTIVECLLGNKK